MFYVRHKGRETAANGQFCGQVVEFISERQCNFLHTVIKSTKVLKPNMFQSLGMNNLSKNHKYFCLKELMNNMQSTYKSCHQLLLPTHCTSRKSLSATLQVEMQAINVKKVESYFFYPFPSFYNIHICRFRVFPIWLVNVSSTYLRTRLNFWASEANFMTSSKEEKVASCHSNCLPILFKFWI